MQDSETGPTPEMEIDGVRVAPGRPWLVEIDVYLDADTNPPRFRLQSALPSKNPGSSDPEFVFENRGRPGFELRFNFYDQTGKGYQFPDELDDTIWSALGDRCPDSRMHEVLEPKRLIDPTSVLVKNDNPRKNGAGLGPFKFTINVTTTGKKPYLPLDPTGDDRNGPRTLARF